VQLVRIGEQCRQLRRENKLRVVLFVLYPFK
jgi:hypothetical protein